MVEELYGTRYQNVSFSLINVGSGFHCLRRFFPFDILVSHRLQTRALLSGLLMPYKPVSHFNPYPGDWGCAHPTRVAAA